MISIDVATLIAVIASPFAILAVVIALFLWLRSEGNADRRHFLEIQKEDRKDMLQMITAIKEDAKDFHYRLLEIERQKVGGK